PQNARSRPEPLDRARDGAADWGLGEHRAADLARACLAAAPTEDIPVQPRSPRRGKDPRRRGAVPQPADECGGLESGRADSDPSMESAAPAAAVAAWSAGPPDSRRPAQWGDESVCRPGDREWPRGRRVPLHAHWGGLSAFPQADRSRVSAPPVALHRGQFLDPFDPGGP